jgi:threonine/homoserine/homoserine lactone efflux protein
VGWVYGEFILVSLAAMLSPTTLSFCVLALVLGDRPFRTGTYFYVGAFTATLAIGVIAAFVLGGSAASDTSSPKTVVAIIDVVAAVVIIVFVVRTARRPPNPERAASMIQQMSKVASSPAVAIIAAGATLANPGAFIPLALKEISETDPSNVQYIVAWLFFTIVSLLPLLVSLILLLVAPERAKQLLQRARQWLERRARTVAFVILIALAAVLLRNGIAGLTA